MGLGAIRAALPEYARDIRLNLDSTIGTSALSAVQAWGTALACAVAARNPVVLREIAAEALGHLGPEGVEAAKGAAAIMAMNNIYYRATHLIGDDQYASMPARLRMQITARPGVDKGDFKLWCLAVSAINGCGICLETHEKRLRATGFTPEQIHEALRISAVVHAAAVTLDAEAALT
ncbi:alkyl hydroperoxide reductase [Micromonospora sp. ALFpr18c]|uniref:carboxymuconolactone decarboxylase family protein n=1 Tax=unclassified Micromonospora TaxID=2617518 RepID=UPI00124B7EB4|nr:carboxymuconolactone decarboxylase family protein [Micromonospora sp. ALFpr18c]KAB1928275.1 alkyl hydroperoxide reductase [Micromonospora sp. ALFpr18c]